MLVAFDQHGGIDDDAGEVCGLHRAVPVATAKLFCNSACSRSSRIRLRQTLSRSATSVYAELVAAHMGERGAPPSAIKTSTEINLRQREPTARRP
jgi:hypothetical protein